MVDCTNIFTGLGLPYHNCMLIVVTVSVRGKKIFVTILSRNHFFLGKCETIRLAM